jgi:S-DNA-T family DNA segregation ATPase FtsK/SpoIIIE
MLKRVALAKRLTHWRLPDVGYDPFEAAVSEQIKAEDIEDAFRRFGVSVLVRDVFEGAHLTTYALLPVGSTKFKNIASSIKDVSLALRISGVRFIESVGDLGCVGIEVPKAARSYPVLDNFLCLNPGYESTGIPVSLGVDAMNVSHGLFLESSPHTLVAGTTGSGKSVFLNSIICSIMRTRTPRQVGLILIDPKQVEFNPYYDIPLLRHPVVTDMKDSFRVIESLVAEMENRYSIIKSYGCQNYDDLMKSTSNSTFVLDRIVCMIDEFADLILTNKKVEEPIVRLAQKGRAAGIHLVIATQRPVVKVVTGLIKANVPTRISFRVSSNLESRIILDQGGAEHLTGKGDMLFIHPDNHSAMRLQAPWVPPQEIKQLADHWRAQSFIRNLRWKEAA